jgi:hypothetical protein
MYMDPKADALALEVGEVGSPMVILTGISGAKRHARKQSEITTRR